MTDEIKSLSDDLSAAWDELEESEESGNESEPLQGSSAEHDEADAPDADESEHEPASEPEPAAAKPKEDAGATKTDDDAPPRGFTAAAREEWKNTPSAIRKEIAKREADFNKGIEKYRAQAQKGDIIDKTVTPYRQMFAQMGVQPPVLIGQLLQTASILSGGNTAAKAQLVANLTKQFGVDVNELDRALAGEQPKQPSQTDRRLQEQLAPIQQELNQLRQFYQQSQQQGQSQVKNELNAFASSPENEFYNDVRLDMADIMDAMNNRGQSITLKEAYDRACHMNPEIRQIIQQRAAAGNLGGKRRAASSVHGVPSGGGGGVAGKTLRDTLSNAFDQAGRM